MVVNKSLHLTNWLIDNHFLPDEETEAAQKAIVGLSESDLKKLKKKIIDVLQVIRKNKTQKTSIRLGIVKSWHNYLRENYGAKFDKERNFDLMDNTTYSET